MKNIYSDDIKNAEIFVHDHNYDYNLLLMLREAANPNLTHSDRWSLIYDYMKIYYPFASGSLITGLSYYVEK